MIDDNTDLNKKINDLSREDLLKYYLTHPDEMLKKAPFTRGRVVDETSYVETSTNNQKIPVSLPKIQLKVVPQSKFLDELDPNCHDVLFDKNIPSYTVKLDRDGVHTITPKKMAIPFQRMIRDKRLLHLIGNPMKFTLDNKEPSEKESNLFSTFKSYWKQRNQDGMRAKMVKTQLSVGDAGLLYYMDYKKRIKCRLISYEDGYIICSHNDCNGDRLLECIYYSSDDIEYIDAYDDKYLYRFSNDNNKSSNTGWVSYPPKEHGFSECPLITKRGNVAWNDAQNIIESYESSYNVFIVAQKKLGWGILYINGEIDPVGIKMGGNILLKNTSLEGGDAKFLNPPEVSGMIDTLNEMKYSIQEASGCTFILPKDIKISGDVSGIAVQLTQSLDIQTAEEGCIEWQNVADKMARLFKEGLGKELMNQNYEKTSYTDFMNLNITASFTVWRPYSKTEYNQMLTTLVGSGILSKESATELNTESKPDELQRISRQVDNEEQKLLEKEKKMAEVKNQKLNKNGLEKPKVDETQK